MPATYRHVYTSEQIEGRHQFSWQKPEPAKPAEYRVFGITCDKRTFDKYNHRDYNLGDGVLRDLRGVELWATGTELAEHFPEFAAEANKIIAQVRAEITGKEFESMNKPRTAADFITALQEIYNESRTTYDAAQREVDKAQAAYDSACEARKKTGGHDPIIEAKINIAAGNITLAKDALRREHGNMKAAHDKKVAELRAEFAAHLDEHYSASPDKLDSNTMALLNSGICNASELARLLDRHSDNPTMLRIVGAHAKNYLDENRRRLSNEDVGICVAVASRAAAARDGSRELAVFDSAVKTADYGLGKDFNHAARMNDHVAGWFDGFRSQMENLPNVPAEMDSGSGGGEE